jgi:osomolarity two-component system, response regulator SSK1
VNFAWFERKVKEWGCMQALIDYAGWKEWRETAEKNGLKSASDLKKDVNAADSRVVRSVARAVEEEKKDLSSSGAEDR